MERRCHLLLHRLLQYHHATKVNQLFPSQDDLGHQVHLVFQDLREIVGIQDHVDHLDHQENLDQLDLKALPEKMD
jgi:hypothetical protein